MKSIKVNRFLNIFNMIFIFIMSIILGVSVYIGNIFSKISGAISNNQMIIEKIITYLDKNSNIDNINYVINSLNITYLLLTIIFIFMIFVFLFIVFLILSFFYKKASEKLSYIWSAVSVSTLCFLTFFIIGQFSLNFFNILFYKNPIFIFINIILLISVLVQVGFAIAYIVYIYKQKGLNFELSSMHKILNVCLVILFVFLGFIILKDIIVLLLLSSFINSIDFSTYLGVNELINYFINIITTNYGAIGNNTSIMLGFDFVKLTISNNINDFISYFIYSLASKGFINELIISCISLIVGIYLFIASIKFKLKENYSIGHLIFNLVLMIFAIYLMFFAKIVVGPILGMIFLVISLVKLYIMYVKSDKNLMEFINNNKK